MLEWCHSLGMLQVRLISPCTKLALLAWHEPVDEQELKPFSN